MIIKRLGGATLAISEATELLEKRYATEPVELDKLTPVGPWLIEKADQPHKTVAAPYSMAKLLNLLDSDEYHCGCVDAVVMATITQFAVSNAQVDRSRCFAAQKSWRWQLRKRNSAGSGRVPRHRGRRDHRLGAHQVLPGLWQRLPGEDAKRQGRMGRL